jgi:hypothetical protein
MPSTSRHRRGGGTASRLQPDPRHLYAIAQRISKQKGGADLIPYVDDMRRKLHRTRSRKAAAESAPAPVSVKA